MKYRQLLPVAIALLLGLPLLAYLWPLPTPTPPDSGKESWAWPPTEQAPASAEAPANLGTFWPGKLPEIARQDDKAAAKPHAETHPWMLVGIIRQSRRFEALVLDPQNNLLTLKPGDALDESRRVIRIDSTRLYWQAADDSRGELLLYPEPNPETPATADSSGNHSH